jgi:hypothetical protein
MRVPVHWATPYLHVVITNDVDGLALADRRTFAGLIPVARRRVRVPYGQLAGARIKNVARWTCFGVAVGVAAGVLLTSMPLLVDVALGAVVILFVLMTFIRGIEVTRDDGRSWTFPICRTHEFDASLAVMDAMQRRDEASPWLSDHSTLPGPGTSRTT